MQLNKECCSYYENLKSKQNRVVTLAQFVTAIASERWRIPVEEYRRCKAEGRLKEAEAIKARMPALVVAGVCEGGHKKANVRTLSGCLMIDIDHYDGDIPALIDQLRGLPWVKAAWVSISGVGVKAIVPVDAETLQEYEEQAYLMVAAYLRRTLDLEIDMACKDLSRCCYASYDPGAFYKKDVPVFPWREEIVRQAAEAPVQPVAEPMEVPKSTEKTAFSGLIANFLEHEIRRIPFVPGRRHHFLLALGRDARYFEMNEADLEQLVHLAQSRLVMPDCSSSEIRRNILDGYRFTDVQPSPEFQEARVKGHWGQSGRFCPPVDFEEQEDVRHHNRQIRRSTPCLPDWIFDQLPEIFRRGLEVAKNPRQRDMLFLSMLANLSACLPNVRMQYDDEEVYPHLFLQVIAPSAAGKGIMSHGARLAKFVQQMFDEENDRRKKEHDEATILWEQECQLSRKEHRKPNFDLRPEPFRRQTLMVPADTSRVQLIQLMSGSPQGLLLNVSELDTLRSAVNAEYGKFDDLMRACFHHEMFGTDFKGDKQSYRVDCAKMAFCASGTPEQFLRLCPSTENGSYSRNLFYVTDPDVHFRSMAPGQEGSNKTRLFRRLGEEVLEIYRYLRANPTDVQFTPDQWDWHKAYFEDVLQGMKMEEEDAPESVVLRGGLIAARIAMIFTALRKYESKWTFYDMKCTDTDFNMAMGIVEVALKHSLMLSTSMQKNLVPTSRMKSYFEVRKALETLPQEFTYTDLINALVEQGLSDSTARRRRVMLLKMQVIEQQDETYRFKNRQWRRLLNASGDTHCPD